MVMYLTNMNDFSMPAGWTQIGETIVLNDWDTYPVKAFYKIRAPGDPMTYNIAQTTGFLAVYRNVDPDNPISAFVHQVSEEQAPAIGDLTSPADGAADTYFFIGLYHSDILAPPGYNERRGCQYDAGSSEDTGFGDRLDLLEGEVSGGNIFVAQMDCVSPGEAPYREGIFHVMLNPAFAGDGNVTQTYQDTGLEPDTTYSYSIVAYDEAGNNATPSAVVSATTDEEYTDTTAPSQVVGLSASAISSSLISLQWNASTDDTGVAGYTIYRDGAFLATTNTTSHTDTGLQANTTYSDAAGGPFSQGVFHVVIRAEQESP
jgi:chitodextrinase